MPPLADGEGDGLDGDGLPDTLGEIAGDTLDIAGVGKLVGVSRCCDWLNDAADVLGWDAAPPTAQASSPKTARPAASANSLLRQ